MVEGASKADRERREENLLREGYEEMAAHDLALHRVFEYVSNPPSFSLLLSHFKSCLIGTSSASQLEAIRRYKSLVTHLHYQPSPIMTEQPTPASEINTSVAIATVHPSALLLQQEPRRS